MHLIEFFGLLGITCLRFVCDVGWGLLLRFVFLSLICCFLDGVCLILESLVGLLGDLLGYLVWDLICLIIERCCWLMLFGVD